MRGAARKQKLGCVLAVHLSVRYGCVTTVIGDQVNAADHTEKFASCVNRANVEK